MPNKHDLSHELVKVPAGETKLSVLQNISDQPVQWTPREDSLHFYYLRPGDFLKVNYDVWVKSETHGVSHLVAGAFPDSYVPTYRAGVVKNETHVQTRLSVPRVNSTLSVMREFPELTIKKNKNLKISIRVPAIASATTPDGIVVQTSIKVNGVDHILCDSDQIFCSADDKRVAQTYVKVMVLDLIAAGIVPDAITDYTIRVKLSAKSGDSVEASVAAGVNSSDFSPFGTALASAKNQNALCVIVEELDR